MATGLRTRSAVAAEKAAAVKKAEADTSPASAMASKTQPAAEKEEEKQDASIAGIVGNVACSLAGASGSRTLVPFFASLFIARKQTPAELTLPAIHFALITLAILSTREGFRRACNRQPVSLSGPPAERRAALQRIVNTAWLSVPSGFVVATIVCPIFIVMRQRRNNDGVFDSEYAYAVFLQAFATVLESCGEPMKSLAKAVFRFRISIVDQLSAAIVGVLTTFTIMSLSGVSASMFGYSRIAVACTSVCIMTTHYVVWHDDDFGGGSRAQVLWRRAKSLLPTKIVTPEDPKGSYFDTNLLLLARGYSMQTFMRIGTAEGLKVVLASVASESDQGVFGLVAGLCVLYRSLFLWPVETASFQAFSLAFGVGSGAKSAAASKDNDDDNDDQAANATRLRARARKHDAFSFLMDGTRVALYAALVCTCFGPELADLIVLTLYGATWASTAAPAVLADYFYLLALWSVNSLTETFMYASASSSELWYATAYSLCTAVISMGLSAVFVTRFGPQGLVLAAATKFVLNIAYSSNYVYRYRLVNGFDKGAAEPREAPIHLSRILPSTYVVATALASRMALWALVRTSVPSSVCFGTALALFSVVAAIIFATDPLFLASKTTKTTTSSSKSKQM